MISTVLYKLALIAPTWIGPIMSTLTSDPGAGTGGDHGGDQGGPPQLPSLVGMLFGTEGVMHHWIDIIYAFACASIMIIVATRVYAKREMIPGPLQNFVEILVEGMYNFLYSVLGKDARKYTPFLGTLFFYILLMNFMGMIPLGHSPSTSVNITASLAICTFGYTQWTGMTRLGFVGWLDHMAGEPRDAISWALVILMFPMHLIGEIAKPFSLAIRLFGNITGEDVLVAAFVGLGVMALSFISSPVGLPLHTPFILLGILLSTIQALVFTLLSTIYILMMLPHSEEH